MKILTSLVTARVLVIIGLLVTAMSVAATFSHLGKEEFMFRGENGAHAWHHLFREGVHGIGAMIAILFFMFANARYRNVWMWWGMLITAIALYAGYWLGIPVNPAYGEPAANVVHIPQPVLVVGGMLIARRYYTSSAQAI